MTFTDSSKSIELDRDEALVVIHRDERVVACRARASRNAASGTSGPDSIARRARRRERGRDDVGVLVAEQAVLARVRVEPDDADPRRGERRSRATSDAATSSITRAHALGGQRRATTSASGTCTVASATLSFGPDEEHHDVARAEPVGEHLGVAGEREAGAPRPGLRDRRGGERGELAALAAATAASR